MPKYRLYVNSGRKGITNHIDIEGGTNGSVLIGRDGQCDLVVDDRRVSRRHARISWGEGRFCVEDLGSTNGTYINNDVNRIVGSIEFTTVDKIDLAGASFNLTCALVLRDLEAERADTQPIKIHQP